MSQQQRMPTYGGQALIEGVMMRSSRFVAAAMRAPDGSIQIHEEPLGPIYSSKLSKVPFLRGMVLLWDALVLGTRILTVSANLQAGEDEKIEKGALASTMAFSMVLAVGLFFVLPAVLSHAITGWLGMSVLVSNLVEGVIRLLIIVGYIWGIGKMPEISRVFAYHGAEHKTINAFEAREELTPENVARYPLEHPRCGTSFILTLIVLSILVFALIGDLSPVMRILSRILLIPPLAGIAYEYIRWAASHIENGLVRVLIVPNLALQKLTTREPDSQMLEVSIAALNRVLDLDKEAA